MELVHGFGAYKAIPDEHANLTKAQAHVPLSRDVPESVQRWTQRIQTEPTADRSLSPTRLHLRCLGMNSGIASQEAVRGRKGPHPGLGCPGIAVGTVIRSLESLSVHDSQLATKSATQVLLRGEIPPVLRVFGHLKPYLSLRNAPL